MTLENLIQFLKENPYDYKVVDVVFIPGKATIHRIVVESTK